MSIEAKEEFRPKIVAFCCNWCSYAGADLAGSSRLSYPADVKIIRVPCSCRVNPMFILRAFEKARNCRCIQCSILSPAASHTAPATVKSLVPERSAEEFPHPGWPPKS